jgi:o-succinylbenzoate synthase
MIHFRYFKHDLQFAFDAKTSRGAIKTHAAYIVEASDYANPMRIGYGEAAPLLGLSIDAVPEFEKHLVSFLNQLNEGVPVELLMLADFPSIRFGIETALLDLQQGGKRILFNSDFIRGQAIPINGLVWMNALEPMLQEAQEKVNQGFDCIKFKIGAHDFDAECRMLEKFRKINSPSKVQIRLDANGAFNKDDAYAKLKELRRFEVHSIEQPIAPKQFDAMAKLCKDASLAIALDEELIGIQTKEEKEALLKLLKPAFIILKPTLIGGLAMADNWIQIAEKLNINWWSTSALESNIGLNAIAQWVATKACKLPQGLGTGALYLNNFNSPLFVKNGHLYSAENKPWKIERSLMKEHD